MLVPHRFALTTVRSASKYLYCSSLNVINLSDTKLSFTKRVNKGWITTVKNLESRRFERYPLVRANRGIVGCCTFLECRGALPLAEIWRHGFVNTLLEWEAFYWFLRPVTFLVPFLDQLLGCNVCLWLQQSQGSRVFLKTGTFPHLSLRSLRSKLKVRKISSAWLLSLIYEGSDLTVGVMTLSK